MKQFDANRTFLQLPENARARSLLKSIGYDSTDLKRPRIGVANTWGETSPGHVHLRGVADAVKAGIWQAGGTPGVMKRLAEQLELDTPTVSGRSVGQNLEKVRIAEDCDVIRSLDKPIARESLVILRGSLARSAVVRTPVILREMFRHKGPARVFDSQEEARPVSTRCSR